MKINEVEAAFAQKLTEPLKRILHDLSYNLPDHYRLRVSMSANGRKKKSNAEANNWAPESGEIEIRFEPATRKQDHLIPAASPIVEPKNPGIHKAASHEDSYVHPALGELLRALDRAESRPGWNFVPLKKFRDEILPQEPREL
ncbi:MAG: hypothetical protein ACM3SW_00005, partial [Actinomycetota bacterium]